MKNKSLILLLCVALLIGIFGYFGYDKYQKWTKHKTEQQSQVLLERIQEVSKLITVEGHFSEIVDYKDYVMFDWLPFQKKALIRVKAKVSVGYDLGKMNIAVDSENKEITISQLPEPEILSIEHDMDYYDLKEGAFNSFTREDYNKVNKFAKDEIRLKAQESDLLDAAKKQGVETLKIIEVLAQAAGYKVVYQNDLSLMPSWSE